MADSANALVRLKAGEAGLPAFEARLAKVSGRTTSTSGTCPRWPHQQKLTTFEPAACCLRRGGAARRARADRAGHRPVHHGGAGRPAGAANARDVAHPGGGLRRRRPGLGRGRRDRIRDAGCRLASRWFPIGTGATMEPAPGLDVDALVLVSAAWASRLLVLAGAAVTAGWAHLSRWSRADRSPLQSVAAATAPRWIAGAGRGRHPLRAGVRPWPKRRAGPFGAGRGGGRSAGGARGPHLRHAATMPRPSRRFGQTHELEARWYDGEDFVSADQAHQVLNASPQFPGHRRQQTTRSPWPSRASDVPVTLHMLRTRRPPAGGGAHRWAPTEERPRRSGSPRYGAPARPLDR